MIFKEFGNRNKPVIVFLHGGGLSWWSWKPQIDALQNDYYIVTPIIDGHGDDWNTIFISIKRSAEQVIEYIKRNCNGSVFAICGLSIGAQITVEILSQESHITENAVVESALVYPMKAIAALTVPIYNMCYGLIKKRWYAKLQAKTLNVSDDMFEQYFLDSSRMTKESLINMTNSNGNYPMPLQLSETKSRVLILAGEKELGIMKKSATLLHNTVKDSVLRIIPKSGHGEISLIRNKEYVELVRDFFNNNLHI